MRLRSLLLTCVMLLAIGLFMGFIAPAPHAAAQASSPQQCNATSPSAMPAMRPLASTSGFLQPRDGTGFFATNAATIAVRSATDDAAVQETTQQVTEELGAFYADSEVAVVSDLTDASRVVMIDGDIAIPGEPTVFTIGGVRTLYLHWTSASSDLAGLLDVPSFNVLSLDETSPTCGVTEHPPAPPLALPPPEPDNVLAFVDDEPSRAITASSAGGVIDLPLADATPTQQWPFPVAAAALLATGAAVLYRSDKTREDRPESDAERPIAMFSDVVLPVESVDEQPRPPRIILLDDAATTSPPTTAANREIDLQAKLVESPLARLVERVSAGTYGPVLSRSDFARHVHAEWSRHAHGGSDGAVASLGLSELHSVRLRFGNNAADQLFTEVAEHVSDLTRTLDIIGLAAEDELVILMPDIDEHEARQTLDRVARQIAAKTFEVLGERVLLTPATGYALLSDTENARDLIHAVENARALSMLNLHLDPERWDRTAIAPHAAVPRSTTVAAIKAKLRTPVQIMLSFVIAWVLPLLVYLGLASIGLDVSWAVYLFLVLSLVLTGMLILAEGMMSIKQKEPPAVPATPYPKASALIAAYLPNEAATVIDTIDAFLAVEYPNDVQIILAYNTPDPLPVEEHLDRIAAEHPNFVPVRVVGSNSKAQNVNAALSMVTGEFVGMFDADHQPRPDVFTRAWRWIDAGYDVVQGHCLTRNGDAGFLAKMIAVEFESIYAVAHPGRAKMHRFGVFGGSNGFWRTELLHETRMRGSMLTEDIDSSMRVVERGFKIRSDRDLVSRELATTTFKQIWNQRMRWAQGWFQVSLEHMKLAYRSKELTVRQKFGIFHLLTWREIYPWLSQQLVPLLAFWAIQAGGVEKLEWTIPIFLLTTIFTLSVGPLQTLFAYKLADAEIKQHKRWFWAYLFFDTLFYAEYKNLIARVAHIKQLMGESDWRVTPRSSEPAD